MRPESKLMVLAFFGGGSGGHLFPGIAVAERARERFPGCRSIFYRTSRSVEDKVFCGRDIETRTISLQAPGKSVMGWIRYSRQVVVARHRIRSELSRGCDIAFGLGGYASVPGILAARAERVPVILLEQNRVPGRVNKLLAPWVAAVSCSYPGTEFRFSRRSELTGNPVRREVLEAAERRAARAGAGDKHTVLVVGGSQGSSGINRALRDALPGLLEFRDKIRWIHLAGDADKNSMMEAYRTHGWEAEVLAYSPQLPDLMARSDLVVGRAGGTTLSELAVMGLPSILVPYPYHGDKHQLLNAQALLERGGARLVEERDLNAESLRTLFKDLLFSPERLQAMERSARSFARPDATDAVINLALDLKSRCQLPSVSSS